MSLVFGALSCIGCGPTAPPADVATGPPEPLTIEPSRPAPAQAEPDPVATRTLLGRWEGIGKQDSGPTWKMILTISSLERGKCATVSYPSIPCGGVWRCDAPSDGFVLQGVEIITEGVGRCHNGVPVMVRLARDRESIAFAVEAGVDSAVANLRRVGDQEGDARGETLSPR